MSCRLTPYGITHTVLVSYRTIRVEYYNFVATFCFRRFASLICFVVFFCHFVSPNLFRRFVHFRTGLEYSDFAVVAAEGSFGSHENVTAMVKNLSTW